MSFGILVLLSAFSLLAVALGETQVVELSIATGGFSVAIGVAMTVAGYYWPCGKSESKDMVAVLLTYIATVSLARLLLWVCFENSRPTLAFGTYAGAQAVMLAGFVGVFANPLVPQTGQESTSNDRYREYLRVHMTNWWRVGQFFITFGLTIGATLLLNVIPGVSSVPGMSAVAWLALPFGIQISLILYYIRWKMNYVEEEHSIA